MSGPSAPRQDTRVFPHSGTCERCLRERDDLFWHALDRKFYCADVFRCEQRYYILSSRPVAGIDTCPGRELRG